MRRILMSSKLYTFAEIFDYKYESDGRDVSVDKIIIPIIQRDYAQGRASASKVRERFLDALYKAITEEPITLDFIYGDLEEKVFINDHEKKETLHVLTPLDGQQRLTTLYLLHWYAAKREGVPKEEYLFLKSFTYETRFTARDFCNKLIDFNPSFDNTLSSEIADQNWFPLGWFRDPTISGMLVVLDAIHQKFFSVTNIWEKLKSGAISFYFLPIKNMGLTDELYIKMNSRGKPLTTFENFKAELEQELSKYNKDKAKDIVRKFDNEWTDLFWLYNNHNSDLGNKFLNYFRFIYTIYLYEKNETPQGKVFDEIDMISDFFNIKKPTISDNIRMFENYFDCWVNLESKPSQYLSSILNNTHDVHKILIDQKIDVFKDVINDYGRSFPLPRVILIYAIITYLNNSDTITSELFIQRLRIINNLIKNSADEISDSVSRVGGNRMPAILKQTKRIILTGEFEDDISINFNEHQLREEKLKLEWLVDNENRKHILFKLEDHFLLYGQTQIIALEDIELADKFHELFNCDKDLINKAMLAIGDYGQVHRGWRLQLGAKQINAAWEKLFHRSSAIGFENTQRVLKTILSTDKPINNEYLLSIIKNYVNTCEENKVFEWRYYFIKYEKFRPNRYGLYYLDGWEMSKYEIRVIYAQQKVSEKSYQPYLAEVDEKLLSIDSYGKYSVLDNMKISFTKSSIRIEDVKDGTLIENLAISQTEDGIDTEDRIIKLKNYLKTKRSE